MKLHTVVMNIILGVVMSWSVSSSDAYEVWVSDQSDTSHESGGYLHVYDGAKLASDPANTKPSLTINAAKDINAFCHTFTQKDVRRPHMIFATKDHQHVMISFLSGHVLVMEAASKKPVACISTGKNVHAAWPAPDQTLAVAANIPEKKLIRIWTDYQGKSISYDPNKDVMDLQALESAERPDNAPICPITDDTSTYAFVTLRGGGLLVVNVKDTPMKVVATLTNNDIQPAGCGGYQIGNTMYVNSGGGWPIAPLSYNVYAVTLTNLPDSVSAKLISSRDTSFADSHGLWGVGRYLWNVDRAGNMIEIFDSLSNFSVRTIQLKGSHSDDPAPDLIGFAPDGTFAFVNLRGPNPLTGNHKDVDNAKGSTPGVAVIKVLEGGKGGTLVGITRLTNMVEGKETADPHGLAVVHPLN